MCSGVKGVRKDNGEKGELTKFEFCLIVRWSHVFDSKSQKEGKRIVYRSGSSLATEPSVSVCWDLLECGYQTSLSKEELIKAIKVYVKLPKCFLSPETMTETTV